MVTAAILSFFGAFIKTLLSLIPSGSPPAFISQVSSYTSVLWTNAANLGAWIPWSMIATVLSAWFIALGIALVIRFIRFVQSSFTGGGGAV